MKSDVSNIDSSSYGHGERLNGAIEVLVRQRVLIVPDPIIGASYLVTHKPNAIVTRIGLDPGY